MSGCHKGIGIDVIQVDFGFDVISRLAGFACDLGQATGIAAVAAANHNYGIDRFGQAHNFGLTPLGGIANRIKYFIMRVIGGSPIFYGFK